MAKATEPPWLPHDPWILDLHGAAISAQFTNVEALESLRGSIPAEVYLPTGGDLGTALLSTLQTLNAQDFLRDDSLPFRAWLKNAVTLAGAKQEAGKFEAALDLLPKRPLTRSGGIFMVPFPRNDFFIGREDLLQRVADALQSDGAAALSQMAAIHGLGGIGKTQAAVRYAYEHRQHYQHVLWVRAETENELQTGFGDIARELKLEVPNDDPEALRQIVMRNLESTGGWLLVFDNADHPELLKPYLPRSGSGHVLITSRDHEFGSLSLSQVLEVEKLEPGLSLEFLLKRARRESSSPEEQQAAKELAEELGHLPLALEQAGAYIAAKGSLFSSYLASFRKRGLGLLEKAGPQAGGYPSSVAKTWLASFEAVEAESPAAAELLRFSTFLAPDKVPFEILTAGASALSPLLSEALEDAGEDALVMDELLTPLARFSLVQILTEDKSFSMHRLVQEVLRASMDCELNMEWKGRVFSALSSAFPVVEFATWPLCERLLAQAETAHQLMRTVSSEFLGKDEVLFLLRLGKYQRERGWLDSSCDVIELAVKASGSALGTDTHIHQIARANLAVTLLVQGDHSTAREYLESALAHLVRLLGEEHTDTLTTRGNLAKVLHYQGDLSAAHAHEESVLASCVRLQGEEHPDTLQARVSLAMTLHALGDLSGARAHEESVLASRVRLQGEEHPDTLQARASLARTLHDLGDLSGALAQEESVLASRIRLRGAEHLATLMSRTNLAMTLKALGDLSGARAHEESALKSYVCLLGEEHLATLSTRGNLAMTLHALGDLSGALAHQESVLASLVCLLGEEHPATLSTRGNLARTLHDLGDLSGAREHEESVLASRVRLLGEEHPATLKTRANLAMTLHSQGDLPGARAHGESVLASRVRLLGEEHPDTLVSQANLAMTLFAEGDSSGARAHEESVLTSRVRLLGEEHPDTLKTRANLAMTLHSQGDLSGARAHGELVLASLVRLLGEEHPDTLKVRGNLAMTLHSQGDLSGARAHEEAVLASRIRLLGEEHPDTLLARGNLARTLLAQGDLPGASVHEESVLASRARLLGEDHPNTLLSRGNLARMLFAQGDLSGARAHEESVLASRVRLLGEEHPDTLTTRGNLARTLFAQGDLSGAREHEESVLASSRRLLGEENPDTLLSRANLATTLHSQGDLSGARAHLESVLASSRRSLGEEHPRTWLATWNLFKILEQQGDEEAAGELLGELSKLVERDPESIASAQVREIRSDVAANLAKRGEGG